MEQHGCLVLAVMTIIHPCQQTGKPRSPCWVWRPEKGQTVPVGDPHFSSRLISLPDQSNTLGGLLNMLIQAVDCTKTGCTDINLCVFRGKSRAGIYFAVACSTCAERDPALTHGELSTSLQGKGDCQSCKNEGTTLQTLSQRWKVTAYKYSSFSKYYWDYKQQWSQPWLPVATTWTFPGLPSGSPWMALGVACTGHCSLSCRKEYTAHGTAPLCKVEVPARTGIQILSQVSNWHPINQPLFQEVTQWWENAIWFSRKFCSSPHLLPKLRSHDLPIKKRKVSATDLL